MLEQGTHKLGLGVSLESMPEDLEQQMQRPELQNEPSPPY